MSKKPDPRFALWTFYVVMVLEILFMISPAALYFYSVYGPALNLLHASPWTSWLTTFFLPHFSHTNSPVLETQKPLAAILILSGLGGVPHRVRADLHREASSLRAGAPWSLSMDSPSSVHRPCCSRAGHPDLVATVSRSRHVHNNGLPVLVARSTRRRDLHRALRRRLLSLPGNNRTVPSAPLESENCSR